MVMHPKKSSAMIINAVILLFGLITGRFCQTPSRLCEDNTIEYCNDYESLSLSDKCFENKTCDPENKYYTFDGSCNNMKFPMWGQANNGFLRLLKADYADGFKSFKTAKNGEPLPNARNLANTLFSIRSDRSNTYTVHFYGFGQFVTHDVAAINVPDASMPCCVNNTPSENMVEECMPILVFQNDTFYSKFNVTCLEGTRATSTEDTGCKTTPTFKNNIATAFLDLSILYSSNKTTADDLRRFHGGELKSIENKQKHEFPPIQNSCPQGGLDPIVGGSCMMTGDLRHNQNPELTVQDVIFFRSHNFIARNLAKAYPNTSDETLFQETRRLLIALYQHVVFKEFLPILLGDDFMKKYNLYPLKIGYAESYDEDLNPGTDSHYEAGAGRFPHSMILGNVNYLDDNNSATNYSLRDKFFNQKFLVQGDTFKNINIAYAKSKCEEEDEHHSEEVRNYLLKSLMHTAFGSDLVTIDLSRARDFGLRSWNDVRKACSLPTAASFDDLNKYLFNSEVVENMRQLYNSVEDIDYYAAGLYEKQLQGSISGPSAVCIIGDAFYRWKNADRLHYQFKSAQFSPEMLWIIRKVASYALFLCMSNPQLQTIQKYPFKLTSTNNPMIKCEDVLEDINSFTSWKL